MSRLNRNWVLRQCECLSAGPLPLYILPRNLRNAIRTYKSFLIEYGVMMKPRFRRCIARFFSHLIRVYRVIFEGYGRNMLTLSVSVNQSVWSAPATRASGPLFSVGTR